MSFQFHLSQEDVIILNQCDKWNSSELDMIVPLVGAINTFYCLEKRWPLPAPVFLFLITKRSESLLMFQFNKKTVGIESLTTDICGTLCFPPTCLIIKSVLPLLNNPEELWIARRFIFLLHLLGSQVEKSLTIQQYYTSFIKLLNTPYKQQLIPLCSCFIEYFLSLCFSI